MTGVVLALDVGGTKLAAAMCDLTGRVLRSGRVATPPDAAAEVLWHAIEVLVDRIAEGLDVVGVGIGCGGPMTWPAGEVSPLNIPGWRDFPLRARMAARFPDVPVRLHNDAMTATAGEHWRGAGRGKDHVLGMVVSTGVGGGLVLGGHLVDGHSGNAGHIGHVVVDPNGPPCICGGQGCLEAIARGPAVALWAHENGWREDSRTVGTAQEVADDAARGHPVARAALARAGHALGVAIASTTHLLDLEVVCVGGGLSQAGPLLFDPLEETFRRHARMEYAREVRVVPVALGQEAGLVGAAALVIAGDRYWNGD